MYLCLDATKHFSEVLFGMSFSLVGCVHVPASRQQAANKDSGRLFLVCVGTSMRKVITVVVIATHFAKGKVSIADFVPQFFQTVLRQHSKVHTRARFTDDQRSGLLQLPRI